MDRSASEYKKPVLLTIALLAIGMYFLPATLSLYAGQHSFYNGSDVSCRKCHEDIYNEIYPTEAVSPPHSSFGQTCNACHRTGYVIMLPPYGGTGLKGVDTAQLDAHAAVTVQCVFCHNLVANNITNSQEVHGSYYNASNQSTLLKGGNEACVGCHTHTTVTINWTRNIGYNMNVTENVQGAYSVEFFANDTAKQTNITSSE